MTALKELASLVGFHESYTDSFGQQIEATDESRIALLNAMGYEVASDDQIRHTIDTFNNDSWLRILPQTQILKSEDKEFCLVVSISEHDLKKMFIWEIKTENGDVISGEVHLTDRYLIESKNIDSVTYHRYTFHIPHLVDGYHNLEFHNVSESSNKISQESRSTKCNLIVAPKVCYGPRDVSNFKMWGFAAQLYSLKSETSWGIGDFGDLETFVVDAANKGASTIGLNPLHPL